MRRSAVIRIAGLAAAVVVPLVLGSAPASAHTISGPKPTNYRSRVVAIAPAVAGISARVVDLGSKIELTNRTSTEVTVLGYESEPYLRIGPDGVLENLRSQATYINRSRLGGTVPPDIDTSPTATPQWKKISSGHSARWHDHRIHWMSAQPPPLVAESPGTFHHLSQQNIVLLRNGESIRISVALDWVPGPSGAPWIPAIVVLFAVGLAGAVAPRWWRFLAVLVGLLVLADIAHAVGFEIPRPGAYSTKVLQFLGGSFVSIAVWAAAVPTVIALARRRVEALYGVLFVALLIALIGGATDLSALWKSQVPDAGPAWLTRVEVVIALGLGAGLVVGALVRMIRSRGVVDREGRGQWLSLLVAGLSDAELERIARELDADEVIEVALGELATRAAPVRDAFGAGSVAFVVTGRDVPVAWSIAAADDATAELRVAPGAVEPVAAEIRGPFAAMLRLFAGTLALEVAVARAVIATTGDAAVLARLAPYVPETSVSGTTDDPAPAS